MAFAAYATVAETKSWLVLNDTIDDVEIAAVLDTVTRWIDEYCDRHFWQDGAAGSEVARVFAPSSSRVLALGGSNDLVSVTTVKSDEDGDGTFETTWAAGDYELHPVNRPTGRPYDRVEAIGARQFPVPYSRGSGATHRVQITGIWGWTAVPDPVHHACKLQASRVLDRRNSPQGVAGPAEFGVVRISRFDPDVTSLLDPYRRVAVLVG